MPISMLDSPIRCCLPEEEFLLVNARETQEMHSYRGFALSFLPHYPCISRLMVALGIECEQRLESLVAEGECLGLAGKLAAQEIDPSLEAQLRRQHFFVVDDDIARLTLAQIVAASFNFWLFYQVMLESCSTPALGVLLRQFVEQKLNACRVLEEVQDTWDSSLGCQRPRHVMPYRGVASSGDRVA
jgi:hypothetical protein